MTNTEITLDQLQAISGGAAFMKIGGIRGEYRKVRRSNFAGRGCTSPKNNVGGSVGPGGDDV